MNTRLIFLIIMITLFTQGCGTKSSTVKSPPKASTTKTLTPEQLIAQAKIARTEKQQASLYLKAASNYCKAQLLAQCSATIREINHSNLSSQETRLYFALQLQLSEINDPQYLIQLIEQIPAKTLHSLPLEEQQNLYISLSEAYIQTEQNLEAAITLFENIGLFPDEKHGEITETAWQSLRAVEINKLTKFTYTGQNTNVLAWLDLAQTISLNQINLDNQYTAFQSWKLLWPDHPAATNPPTELALLNELPTLRPKVITLALPLTGPIADAGIAIRDGFLAAHYSSRKLNQTENRQTEIEIQLIDTNKQDIRSLYNSPIKDNIIIGPLDKDSIAKISELDEINITTLALNKFDNNRNLRNIYQLSLAPETEAIQAAEYMNSKGFEKAALILPENNLGFRIHDSFVQAFSEHKGLVIDSTFYSNQETLAETVSLLLGTQESKERQRKIRSITGESFVFYPRRRKDIDSIFMIAKPEIAKQLKPLFAFNYAANLPVFSTSHIHRPNESTTNRDLDDIQFLDMPWMLNETINIKQNLYKTLPEINQSYSRFHALGADAYTLVPRLKLLQEVKGSKMQGHSGLLQIDEQGVIHRNLQWATFKRGKINNLRE